MVKRLQRTPFVFDVRDIWPESAVVLDLLTNKYLISLAERLERTIYREAKTVTVAAPAFKRRLLEREVLSDDKIEVVYNGLDEERFSTSSDWQPPPEVKTLISKDRRLAVVYLGIHGPAQAIEQILFCAGQLREHTGISFIFIGDGEEKNKLVAMKGEMGLDNVAFLPPVPRESVPSVLQWFDVGMVPLANQPLFWDCQPVKLFEYMANGLPVVVCAGGELERFVQENNVGLAVPSEQPEALAAALLELANEERRKSYRHHGRDLVLSKFTRKAQAKVLLEILAAAVQ